MHDDRPAGPRGARGRLSLWRPLAGAALAVVAAPLLIFAPEVGLPLAFVALRLLATRFAWAARAEDGLRRAAQAVKAWFTRLTSPMKVTIGAAAAATLAAAAWWTVSAAS